MSQMGWFDIRHRQNRSSCYTITLTTEAGDALSLHGDDIVRLQVGAREAIRGEQADAIFMMDSETDLDKGSSMTFTAGTGTVEAKIVDGDLLASDLRPGVYDCEIVVEDSQDLDADGVKKIKHAQAGAFQLISSFDTREEESSSSSSS